MASIDYTVDPSGGTHVLQGTVGDDQLRVSGATSAALLNVLGLSGYDTLVLASEAGSAIYLDQPAGTGASVVAYGIESVTLAAGPGAVDVYGGNADDVIDGGTVGRLLSGGQGKDRITGGHGATLDGGIGDDLLVINGVRGPTIYPYNGNPYSSSTSTTITVSGGDGVDTVDFSASGWGRGGFLGYFTIDLTQGTATSYLFFPTGGGGYTYYSGTATLSSVENAIGTLSEDTIYGDVGGNLLSGGAGGDFLYGQNGIDILRGGEGDDLLDGGDGNDTADYSDAPAGIKIGVNPVDSNGYQDTVGAGRDRLVSIEAIIGSAFDDQITFSDSVRGGAGNDSLRVTGGASTTVSGEDGDDTLSSYNEVARGFGTTRTYYNTFDGGAGFDTADLGRSAFGHVFADLATGAASSSRSSVEFGRFIMDVQAFTLIRIEGVIGTFGDDQIKGDANGNALSGREGSDDLQGRGGDDTLLGGLGTDRLRGGAGNDLLDGGEGYDTADYEDAASSVAVTLETENQQQTYGAGIDRLVSIEALAGSGFADMLIGNGGDNVINGRGGEDRLYGLGGNDQIAAGIGNDYVLGGDGDDKLYGEDGGDILAGGEGDDVIDGGAGDDVLYGENGTDQIAGGDGRDVLYGQGGTDTLYGQAGDDVLLGGEGNDVVYGGGDNDNLYGEGGADTILGGAGIDYVSAGAEDDIVYGEDGNDQIGGDGGNDQLHGGAGQDQIYGQDGNDILIGGAEADYLFGGAGQDLFVFGAASDSSLSAYDYVLDFETGYDVLDFRQAAGGGPASASLVVSGGSTLVYLDLGQDGTNDMVVYVNGVTNLTTADLAL